MKGILSLIAIGLVILFAGCSGDELKSNVDNSTITEEGNITGTNKSKDDLRISEEKLELYPGETKEVYLEVSDKSKLSGMLYGEGVVEVLWDIENQNADGKVIITVNALNYGEATIALMLGEVSKQIFVTVKETDEVNGLFVNGMKINEYMCYVRGNYGMFSSDKFDIKLYYPEGFVVSEYDVLGITMWISI